MSIQIAPIGRSFTGVFDQGAAEIPAYDPASKRLFVVNGSRNSIDVIDLTSPTSPTRIESIIFLTGANPTSVATNNGVVAAALADGVKTDRGDVVFFRAADSRFLSSVPVGALPDSLAFSPDGTQVVVADEGEPDDSYEIDPEGTISIIDLSSGVEDPSVTTLTFDALNGSEAELNASGVRIFGPNATVAQDLEPESVAIAPNGQTAFVTLQENNAVAIVDLEQREITNVVPLGTKDFSLPGNGIDASDRDGGINIQPQPVQGLFQPDGIVAFESKGETFYITANEGDARDTSGFSEELRLLSLPLDPVVFPDAATLQQEENLGRLKVTNTLGDRDGDGDFEEIFAFGGRSFSIWDSTGNLVFDSGSQFEQRLAALLPDNFNANNDNNDSFDSRSDDKGPEPEGLAVGIVDDTTYAFIGLERVGGIMVYDITDPVSPIFVDYFNNRNFSEAVTRSDGLSNPAAGDLGPEGLLFISADDSPNSHPLLVAANEVSGTTTIYEITSEPVGIQPSQVLYIAGSAEPGAGDQLLIDRLRSRGHEVTVRDDDGIQASAALGQDLILVSESVVSGKVGRTFTDIAIPLVTWEPFLYDDLTLTGGRAGVDFGSANGQTQVNLASGGLQAVYNQPGQISWGVPTADADVLATLANNSTRASTFSYDAGDTLADGRTAAASRVGLFLHDFREEATFATTTGLNLFDDAIAKALGETNSGGNEGGTPQQPDPIQVLFVASSLTLNSRDAAIKNLLESRSDQDFVVTVQDDNQVRSSDANGKDLILISESVFSGNVGDVFATTAVPLVSWEAYLYDDLGMTGRAVNQDFGSVMGRTEIATTGVLISDRFGERAPVYTSPGQIGWGVPTEDAIVSATLVGNENRATIFAYESGAQMVGITAPAKRVGLFLQDSMSEFDRITSQGITLFNAAVDFALS